MGAKATTLEEQIQLLRSRGMVINNEEKAKENGLSLWIHL